MHLPRPGESGLSAVYVNLMMFEYRKTKYDPRNRDTEGRNLAEDWIMYSEVGQVIAGRVVTVEEYSLLGFSMLRSIPGSLLAHAFPGWGSTTIVTFIFQRHQSRARLKCRSATGKTVVALIFQRP